MGNRGGTSSEMIAVECLKNLNFEVLHFVEDNSPCDEGNIPIRVHLKKSNIWIRRIYSRLGKTGERLLFKSAEKRWKSFNKRFADQICIKLAERKINSVSLVYCNSALLVECGRNLGKIFNCPVVSHFYGTFLAPCIGNPLDYRKHPFEYFGWITPVDLRICNDDGTHGDLVARDLNLPLEKFLFQPHGIDLQEISEMGDDVPEKKSNDLYVMTSSRLTNWKRIDRVLHAVPEVIKSIANVHFFILGDGPERQNLENISKELGISEKVTFTGPLPRKIVFSYMRKCDVFISTNDISNISRGLKEAMFLNMCIVTIDTGNTGSLIKNGITGMLIPPDDQNLISKALINVLLNEEKRIELGREARSFIEKYEPTQQTIVDERVDRLKSLLGKFQSS